MKTYYTLGLSMLVGIGVGALAVQTLHAETKAPVYRLWEIKTYDAKGHTKKFSPWATVCRQTIQDGGKDGKDMRLETLLQCNLGGAECERLLETFRQVNHRMLAELDSLLVEADSLLEQKKDVE